MYSVTSMAGDWIKKSVFGDNIAIILQTTGQMCSAHSTGSSTSSWSAVTEKALSDCSAFAQTCVKIAFVGTLLTSLAPFLFGSLTAVLAFSSLTCCVLTHDVAEIIKQFKSLDESDQAQTTLFNQCSTVPARLEFMMRSTTFLRLCPTSWVEKSGELLGFIPTEF